MCKIRVSRILIEDHKEKRVDFLRKFLRRYAYEENNFLDSTVICDEIRAFYFPPDIKQQARYWGGIFFAQATKIQTNAVCR